LKRFGAVGGALLVLNEIRGLMVVAALLNGWAQSAHAHPQLGAVAKLVTCGLAC
jgi:hypothetical protein